MEKVKCNKLKKIYNFVTQTNTNEKRKITTQEYNKYKRDLHGKEIIY